MQKGEAAVDALSTSASRGFALFPEQWIEAPIILRDAGRG